jgi:hypothetical protein
MKPKADDDVLAEYAVYLKEIQAKPVEYKKQIWSGLVAKEGLLIAEYVGARLEVDETTVSEWIREWIAVRVRHTLPSEVPSDTAVVEFMAAESQPLTAAS